MSTTRMSILTALAVTACSAPGEPTLVVSSDVSTFDGRTEHAVLTIEAKTATGEVGQGVVTLVAPVGRFVEGAEVTLADGLASATYVCDPGGDPACNGLVQLGASWEGSNDNVELRVTPSVVVTEVRWKAAPTYTLSELNAMAVGSGGKLWAAGNSGAVIALVGSAWSTVPSTTFADLLAMAFTPAAEAVIVGRQGTLLIERSGQLEPVSSDVTVDFTAVTAAGTSDVVIGAADGTLYHFDGAAFTAEASLGTPVLSLATNGAQVWAGGEGALAVRANGAWTPSASPVQAKLFIAAASPEGLWLGGTRVDGSGSVLLLGPTDWRSFEVADSLTALAVVPDSVERFVISQSSVWRRTGVSGAWTSIDAPMGGNAAASRREGDLVIVGPPGMSLIRE